MGNKANKEELSRRAFIEAIAALGAASFASGTSRIFAEDPDTVGDDLNGYGPCSH